MSPEWKIKGTFFFLDLSNEMKLMMFLGKVICINMEGRKALILTLSQVEKGKKMFILI